MSRRCYHSGEIVNRIVDLTLRAQRGPLPCKAALAREYDVHLRTIHRVLAIIEAHVPVRYLEAS